MIRLLPLAVLLVVTLAGSAAHAQSSLKIGVFDPQRVSEESKQGQRLQAELSALQQSKQAELQAKDQALAAKEKEYNEQRLSLSEDRRKALELDIERRKLELKNAQQLATQELQLEYADAQQKFNEMLIRGVSQFGESEGFDLILDMAAVAWAHQGIDVTTAIIDLVDTLYPIEEGAAEAGAEAGAEADQ
jgi:outer membrane protein